MRPISQPSALRILILLSLIAWTTVFLPRVRSVWGAEPRDGIGALIENLPGDVAIHLAADRLEHLKGDDVYRAEGSVVLTQGAFHLSTDALRLHNATGQMDAEGAVRITDGQNQIAADRAEMNLRSRLGVLTRARLFMEEENYFLTGERIERLAENRYALSDATFTACAACNPDWRIGARTLRVQPDGYLVARDVVFYAGDWPILYLPGFLYPTGTTRKTGLLIPRVGWNSSDGPRYLQDFFWAMAKNQDATLTLDHRGARGDGAGLEYRYAFARAGDGRLQVDYFHDDRKAVHRWDTQYDHVQRLSDRISARLHFRHLNRKDTLVEIADEANERAQGKIVSDAVLTYRGDAVLTYLLARYTQNLTRAEDDVTVQRLPEAGFRWQAQTGPWTLDADGSVVYFWRRKGLRIPRADLNTRLSWPATLAPFTITPWVGVRDTFYGRGALEDSRQNRLVFPMGLDAQTVRTRTFGNITHRIQPQLAYQYIGVKETATLPQFDDIDAIADRHAVTASLGQQWLQQDDTGASREAAALRLTETYRIGAPGADGHLSPLRMEARTRLTPNLSADVDAFYDVQRHRRRRMRAWSTDLRWHLSDITLSLGQRYARGGPIPQRGDLFGGPFLGEGEIVPRTVFWNGRMTLKMPWGTTMTARADFDAETRRFVQSTYEVQYAGDCWGITLGYADLPNRNAFSFLIHLKGLSPSG